MLQNLKEKVTSPETKRILKEAAINITVSIITVVAVNAAVTIVNHGIDKVFNKETGIEDIPTVE